MDEFEKLIRHFLQQTATIHIYSFPNFMLETFLALTILLIYILLQFEVTKIGRKMVRLKPNAVYCENHSGTTSKDSICTSVTHYREVCAVNGNPSTTITYNRLANKFSTNSQMGWIVPTHPIDDCLLNRPVSPEKKRYAEQLATLTPEQFVKIDKERKLREKELDSYMTSLSTLCKNVIKKKYSSKTLSRQIAMAQESLQCNKMSVEGKYLGFKTEAMTRSLFSMLEQMITNSSLQNPLPFKGDITTLALDVADLSMDSHYLAKETGKWDANNSSTCVSDGSDEMDIVTAFKEGSWEKDDTVKVNWQNL